jgi:hypothetical protein
VTASATYRCRECGKVASTVTLVAPGEPDPRLTPEPPGVPPGASTILGTVFPRGSQLSIDGGPTPMVTEPRDRCRPAPESLARRRDAADSTGWDSREGERWRCPGAGRGHGDNGAGG